jgi:uncharacterized protein (DUF2249 family)
MPVRFKKLDVRRLLAQGIEPFSEIRRRIDALQPDEGLTVVAPFLPSPLIEKLSGEGFHAQAEHRGDGSWAVHFSRDEN